MYILSFRNMDGINKEISKFYTFNQCVHELYEQLYKHTDKSYYQRFICKGNYIKVDFGHWGEYFEITCDENENILKEYNKYLKTLSKKPDKVPLDSSVSNATVIWENEIIRQKKELMNKLINLYEQVESMDNSETKLVIQEFIGQKENRLIDLLFL